MAGSSDDVHHRPLRMALKLISTLTILVLASFLYKVWDKTKVPEDIPADDVWKVKTIEFACRLLQNLNSLLEYLNVEPHVVGRPLISTVFNLLQGEIWPFTGDHTDSVTIHDRQMAGVPVLHFKYKKPEGQNSKSRAVIIYFHGGGWEWLDAGYPTPTLRMLSEKLEIPAVSVEYRLAPEHVYPAGLEDCLKVTNYIIDNHKELAVDPSKIIVAGDSAGGNLAAAVALKLKKKIKLQVLIYPALQALDVQTPSYRENTGVLKYILKPEFAIGSLVNYADLPPASKTLLTENRHISKATRASKYSSYVHSDLITHMNITKHTSIHHSGMSYSTDYELVEYIEERVLDPYLAPLMADSLDDVTDAYVITAQHDILRDDGLFYCARLNSALNVKCQPNNYLQGFHAFIHFVDGPLQVNSAKQAVNDAIGFIKQHVIDNEPWPKDQRS